VPVYYAAQLTLPIFLEYPTYFNPRVFVFIRHKCIFSHKSNNYTKKDLKKEIKMQLKEIEAIIRDIPDFPEKGIIFKDITPVLQSPEAFKTVIDMMCAPYRNKQIDAIAGIESRGFIFGAAMALELNCAFVPIRKKGKLPYKTIEKSYSLEYGTATIELHTDAVSKGDKVVIVDDLLATGGTAAAAIALVEKLEAEVVAVSFMIELVFLSGKDKLPEDIVSSLIKVN